MHKTPFKLSTSIFLICFFLMQHLPTKASETIVLGVHGLGARAAWLDPLKENLETKGIKYIAKDLPGFGSNHKEADPNVNYKKGHVDSYQAWLDFVAAEIKNIKADQPDSKLIVFGHSLGAVITTNTPNINEADAVILSSPGYKSGANFNPAFIAETVFKYIGSFFGADQYLTMPVSKKKFPSPYANDPYRTKSVTANLLIQVSNLQKQSKKNVSKINSPTLMVQMKDDMVVDTQAQVDLFDLIPAKNKSLKSYEGFDHDWLANPGTEKIFADILDFVESV